ncbi:NlpC/P60 family protein [Streptomyces sp. NPDC005438]|uniref:C40 family peptidase n=1 Tax=Streptomyces sp. NPDC005438 TaxID=3156880 RepID=UPI0033A8394B
MKITQRAVTLVACGALSLGGVTALGTSMASANTETTAACVKSDQVKIKKGSTGNSVREAQCRLNSHGASLEVDGKFGAATDKAVRSFQSSKGLEADGVVGPQTWAALTGSGGGDHAAKAKKVIDFAASQAGKKYVWGADGPNTYDCSGLTLRSYEKVGVTLPRTSGKQAEATRKVAASERQVGDLMHWPGHVGIYAGDGKVWHASRSQGKVVKSNVWDSPTYHRVF